MKLIHLSDIHFGKGGGKDGDHDEAIERTLDSVADYEDHYVIITGDITDSGTVDQYEQAATSLARFQDRLWICPGNHDYGYDGILYDPDAARRFDDTLALPLGQAGTFMAKTAPVVHFVTTPGHGDRVMLIALNSCAEFNPHLASGLIGTAQLESLKTILDDPVHDGVIKVLYLHHHPVVHTDPRIILIDDKALWPVISDKVDLLLFGHRHQSNMWQNFNGIQFVVASDDSPGKATARQITIEEGKILVSTIPIG